MAGLLDIFGSTPDIYAGLLGEEGMAQAKRQAQSDALLNLSAALMKAGAPSRTPQGLGLGLVEGMQAAGRGYKESMQGALQEKLAQQKIAEALASKQRAGAAQQLLTSALQPQMVPEATTGPGGVPYPVNQVRQATLQELIPQFAKYGTEGFDALSKYLDVQKAARPESFDLAEGTVRYQVGPDGKPIAVAGAPKVQRLTGEESNIALRMFGTNDPTELAKIPNSSQQIADAAVALKKAGATTISIPSVEERKGSLFQQQMSAASETIGGLNVDMSNKTNQAAFTAAGGAGQMLVDPKIQQYRQAADQWSEAYLRVKTGAAATPGEVALNNRTFFPIFGDDAATIKLKERMREKAEKDMSILAGRAAKPTVTNELDTNDIISQAIAEQARRRGSK